MSVNGEFSHKFVLGELMQPWMAHSHNHQILANYWDSAYAALDGPQPKTSNFGILLGFGVVPTYVVYMAGQCSSHLTI